MCDLQKILLDNYCKKYNIEISKKELSNDGTWFYWLKMTWDAECKEFVYSCYITALILFPERFGIDTNESEQSQFYPCEY